MIENLAMRRNICQVTKDCLKVQKTTTTKRHSTETVEVTRWHDRKRPKIFRNYNNISAKHVNGLLLFEEFPVYTCLWL